MGLRVQVVGSSGAAPLEGACSAYAVSSGERVVLLDCGPGALERLWQLGLLTRLEAIVISHMHADHILDLLLLAGEVVRASLPRRPQLYVPGGHGPAVLRGLDRAFARSDDQPDRFEATFDVLEYGAQDTLTLGEVTLTFAPTAHAQPCFAARASDGRAALVYGADGGPSPQLEELARDCDLLILEATYTKDEEEAAANGHMTAPMAGELAARAGAQRLLLTHLLPGDHEEIRRLASERFSGPVALARSGDGYEVGSG
jgi:ribonuclease BN (tRNA processing enzyme)